MNKKVIFYACFSLIILTGLTFILTQQSAPQKPEFKASRGTVDNPYARLEYELNRIKDPATGKIPPKIRQKELKFAETLPKKPDINSLAKSGQFNKTEASLDWTNRGPFNVGGRTRALAVDITNENIILAGGASGALFRTTNGGSSWSEVSDDSVIHGITTVVQDTRDGHTDTWYYGTGEFIGTTGDNINRVAEIKGNGIYKSTDGGITWNSLPNTRTDSPASFDKNDDLFSYVWDLEIDTNNGYLYAAVYDAIMRSTDGGNNWTTLIQGQVQWAEYTDIEVTSSGIVYAALGFFEGIHRSSDNGETWANISSGSGFPENSHYRTVLSVAPSNESILYVIAHIGGSGPAAHTLWKYEYVSGDGSGTGGTWTDRSSNIPAIGGQVGDFDSQSGYDLIVDVKPNDADFVIIGGTNLYRSTDGFATTGNTSWIGGYSNANDVSGYPNHHPDMHSSFFSYNDSKILYNGHDGGVSKTLDITDTNPDADGNTVDWIPLNNGYLTTQFYSVSIDKGTDGSKAIVGGLQDNGSWYNQNSNDPTGDWAEVLSGDGAFSEIADNNSFHLVSWQNGTVYKQSPDASTWTKVTPTGASGMLFVTPLAMDPNDNNVLYFAGGSTLWRNSDLSALSDFDNSTKSTNWTQFSNTDVGSNSITAIGVSESPANVVYYGSSNGKVYKIADATVGNPSPSDITGTDFPSGGYISCVAVDPNDANRVFAVFSNYQVKSLFYTEDGGSSWTDVGGNLEENNDGSGSGPSLRWIEIAEPNGGVYQYFVGTSVGVYSTTNLNGTSTNWQQEGNTSIGNQVVNMLDYRASDGFIAAATHASGIYSANVAAPLPVELISFTATVMEKSVELNWKTETEVNNFGFDIERRMDKHWEKISFIEGSGNSNTPRDYSYVDNNPGSGIVYYRLKQIDFDGSFEYSPSIEVSVSIPTQFKLSQNFPNPFNPTTRIEYQIPAESDIKMDIYSITGQHITTLINEVKAAGNYSVDFNPANYKGGLASGVYIYSISGVNKTNGEQLFKTKKMNYIK